LDTFQDYAQLYNLIYREKDYAAETKYIDRLIKQQLPGAQTVLDLGCGTGQHAFRLSAMGYQVTGVDKSSIMLSIAEEEKKSSHVGLHEGPDFICADIRGFKTEKRYDAVIAMFHVMSYQTTNRDIVLSLGSATRHLKPGGIFIFDFWYGPGVLSDPPTVRVKDFNNSELYVTRIAKPDMFLHDNCVDVNYHIFVHDKIKDKVREVREQHRMRYIFKPEIEMFLRHAGLVPKEFFEFMTFEPPRPKSWNACMVAVKHS
jgi:SAM-dependent methyltransferase